ncbi:chlorophyll synthase, chloroplastic-like [Primulina huaijiensis]|uniref:chlorophyll synthase, chloroplastic-like n=1 Tax=Primulina huaijiensis TaxID=1492673 RepID=UPI003CC7816A
MASLLNTVYSTKFSSRSNTFRTPHLTSYFRISGRRLVVRATETDTNEVGAKAPDTAPAESGSSMNQILGIKGAKQETDK